MTPRRTASETKVQLLSAHSASAAIFKSSSRSHAMWWSRARYVACRNMHLNSWAQKVVNQQTRTLVAAPLMRMCADARPVQGFAEQRTSVPGTIEGFGGDAMDEATCDVSQSAVAALIEDVISSLGSLGSLEVIHTWTYFHSCLSFAPNFLHSAW